MQSRSGEAVQSRSGATEQRSIPEVEASMNGDPGELSSGREVMCCKPLAEPSRSHEPVEDGLYLIQFPLPTQLRMNVYAVLVCKRAQTQIQK